MPSKFVVPNIGQMTPEGIIDEMAKLSIIENQAKKLRKFYREALYARAEYKVDDFANGEGRDLTGDTFVATTSRSDPARVNTTRLKEEYPEIAAAVTESNGQLTTRFSLKPGVTNPVVDDLLKQMKQELDLD